MTLGQAERPDLSGLRVLVVEDMMLAAEEIGHELRGCGCVVVGPAARVPAALALVADEQLDGALLDVNLAGEYCYPMARELQARRVPFAFLTGYSDSATFPPEHRAVPRLRKPFGSGDLISFVDRNFRKAA